MVKVKVIVMVIYKRCLFMIVFLLWNFRVVFDFVFRNLGFFVLLFAFHFHSLWSVVFLIKCDKVRVLALYLRKIVGSCEGKHCN